MDGLMRGIVLAVASTLAFGTAGQDIPTPKVLVEPQWQPALAYGGAPDCPTRLGSRTYRSDVVRDFKTTVSITGTAVHKTNGYQMGHEFSLRIRSWKMNYGNTGR